LIFVAVVFGEIAADIVIKNLADFHAGVNWIGCTANILGSNSRKAHVAETGRNVHEKSQTAD